MAGDGRGLHDAPAAAEQHGTSAAGEPIWPTTPGLTVVDNPGPNQVTWTCRTYAVLDVNKVVLKPVS